MSDCHPTVTHQVAKCYHSHGFAVWCSRSRQVVTLLYDTSAACRGSRRHVLWHMCALLLLCSCFFTPECLSVPQTFCIAFISRHSERVCCRSGKMAWRALRTCHRLRYRPPATWLTRWLAARRCQTSRSVRMIHCKINILICHRLLILPHRIVAKQKRCLLLECKQ